MISRILPAFLAICSALMAGCQTTDSASTAVADGLQTQAYQLGVGKGRQDAATGLPTNPAPHSRTLSPTDIGAFNTGYNTGYREGGRVPPPAALPGADAPAVAPGAGNFTDEL